MIYIKFRKYDPCVRMYWLALAWVYTVPSSVAAGVMYQQPLCGLKVHLVWSVPAVPVSPYSAGLTLIQLVWPLFSWSYPYSVGLNLIQPVWPLFSWSDPYSAGVTTQSPCGGWSSLGLVCACSTWVLLFSQSDPWFSWSDPYSAGLTLIQLTLIQPVWPLFSWPLFSRSDPYSAGVMSTNSPCGGWRFTVNFQCLQYLGPFI